MRRLLLLTTTATLAALAVTSSAAAKGPASASLTGPGLGHALPIEGEGEEGPGTPLGSLVELGGVFPQAFAQVSGSAVRARPSRDPAPRDPGAYRGAGGERG